MASFGLYLDSIATPIVKRVLGGLGMGVVTYTGLQVVMDQIKNGVLGNWGAISGAAGQLLGLAGVSDMIGIILGALACRFSMMRLKAISMIP